MAQSQNTKVDYNCKATSLQGLSTYGDVLVGDRAFEFYNEKNPQDYIQIPWDEVDHVSASVVFGKRVTRFAIFTRESGHFTSIPCVVGKDGVERTFPLALSEVEQASFHASCAHIQENVEKIRCW